MKSQKFHKVLTLNKSTVSNLNSEQMHAAKGGYYFTDFNYSCRTWCGCETNPAMCRTTYYIVCDTYYYVCNTITLSEIGPC